MVLNCAAEPAEGQLLARRIRIAHRDHLPNGILPLTWRALVTFDPGVLWTLLHALDYLPAKRPEIDRPDDGRDISTEVEIAKDRLAEARRDRRPELIAMALEMLAEARSHTAVARARRAYKTKNKESALRRRRVLHVLRSQLGDSWGHTDIARLILESPSWRRPPCPTLAAEYDGCVESLADLIDKDTGR